MLKEKQYSDKEALVTSSKELSNVISPDSIVGKPIVISSDLTVLPVLKVSAFFVGGGGEYGDIKLFSSNQNHPFAGGSGTLVNMFPCGFLCCKSDGVNFIKVPFDFTDKVFDKSTELLDKVLNGKG